MNLELRKVYIRHREAYPETEAQAYAYFGFRSFGCEISSYEGFGDVELIKDFGPEIGISGYIGDVHAALKSINKKIPQNVDYPEDLQDFLGRDIFITTLKYIKSKTSSQFIKPLEHKLFTGFVYSGDEISRRRIITCPDDTKVYACQPINILSEYRCFILDNEILDCRLYKGDWSLAPHKEKIEMAVKIMKLKGEAPRAYCLDWGITDKQDTILIEMNEGYAFGHYGLRPDLYVRMLSARWSEMTK